MPRAATLVDSRFCAPHTKHFTFRIEGEERFHFRPGQYVWLRHDFADTEIARPYSIASPPRPDNVIELCLNHRDHSRFTSFLFALQPGDRLRLDGPEGSFGLRPQPRDSLFVATGTGIAPLRSMIHYMLECGAPPRAWLLFGVRSEKGIIYREEFEHLASLHHNFQFVPTLSRPGEGWHGPAGYVQEHITRLLDSRTDVDAYICGLRTMVDEVSTALERHGLDRSAICFERYD